MSGVIKQIRTGEKTVATAGTELPLVATKKTARGLKVTAKSGNAGVVYLGDSTVAASNGYALAAGASLAWSDLTGDKESVVDLNKIYVDAATNGDGVTFVYLEDVAL